ncbi:ABC-type peptide/nickel transport system permease protein [Candidatus Phytoplasma luffae]|uniref:ABC-type peptide/nickel transport system permease protein n=1 Tax=Loofah witches'-broom phytoplasma TaxID=35773 RepID=A0A975FIR9_LOWBP|nr:ABC transporter permease [Candidatus Phytoplasma luffae]QTX02679.1 ABC-type peptide/nickel transport system permease protein [Candidatus Phytoplasma luffae]
MPLNKIKNFFTFYIKNSKLLWSSIFLIILIIISNLVPYIGFYKYSLKPIYVANQSISFTNWFGTDSTGYDIFSRMMGGVKISLSIAFVVVFLSCILGTFLGIISGYFRGFLDQLINFICDFIIIIPEFILVVLIMSFCKKDILALILVLIICQLPSFIRISRINVLELKQKDFIKSSKSLGSDDLQIIKRHILPHILPVAITQITMKIASSILSIAALGFIGLALEPSTPEWGSILRSVQQTFLDYPQLLLGPFLIMFLTILSLNLIGRGLIEYFNKEGF